MGQFRSGGCSERCWLRRLHFVVHSVLLGGALVGSRALAQATPAALEYEVKAAYLLNFTRYVEWPSAAFTGPDAPMTICVVGRDPFGGMLDRMVEGRSVQGHDLQVKRVAAIGGATGCHVAYLRYADLATLRGRPVLTIGDDEGFAGKGGVIGFVPVEETVRFEINLNAARAHGLQISSRMLALAPRVYGRE